MVFGVAKSEFEVKIQNGGSNKADKILKNDRMLIRNQFPQVFGTPQYEFNTKLIRYKMDKKFENTCTEENVWSPI